MPNVLGKSSIVLPSSTNITAALGALRVSSLDFEGYDGTNWRSLLSVLLPSLTEGRLTCGSGSAVTHADQTANTSVYFTPYIGNRLGLYYNGSWMQATFSEISVATPSTVYRPFDIFAYWTGSAVSLETVNWNQTTGSITGATNATPIVITSTSHGMTAGQLVGINSVGGNTAPNGKIWTISAADTNTFTLEGSAGNGTYTSGGTWYKIDNTRATALTTQNGVYVKNGDATRKYLGTCMTTNTSGQTEDTKKRRFCWNYYNRRQKLLLASADTTYWSYLTATFRESNYGSSVGVSRFDYICGLAEDLISCYTQTQLFHDASAQMYSGIGIDVSTTTSSISGINSIGNATQYAEGRANYSGLPGLGYHSIRWLEKGPGNGTLGYFYGTLSDCRSALVGECLC